MIRRTHTCGELTCKKLGNSVSLVGWISKTRDLGGLIFIDLRDRYGKTQIIFNEEQSLPTYKIAKKLGLEDVIGITGKVVNRPEDAVNPNMITGEIDVEVQEIEVFNESEPLPFNVNDRNSAMEEHRLKFRYLELRTEELKNNLILRDKASQIVRKFLSEKKFIDIETPILMKSTPEGARDFLVPSRIHKGRFYALPQSPQTYKQLLMVSGFDRYFQIVKCFRDEDFRADRQPEFTQIDIEMSFIEQQDIIDLGTDLIRQVWQQTINQKLPEKFPILSYKEAMDMYGTDKPDIRFDMKLKDFSEFVNKSDFNVFKTILQNKGIVKAIICPNAKNYSRKIIEELQEDLKQYGAKGLAWMKLVDGKLDGGISKFFDNDLQAKIISNLKINEDEILFLVGASKKIVLQSLGALRLRLAERENLINQDLWKPLWVIDFPLVEWNVEQKRWDSLHHPFTAPHNDDIKYIDEDASRVRSYGYDIVMNGYELGGGSIRIHKSDLQSKIFDLLGIEKQEAINKFGFLLDAFKYGAPPHGGIAFGFDRIVMLLANAKQIRDVIAFPKTTSATSLMDGSPSEVDLEQLNELGLKIKK